MQNIPDILSGMLLFCQFIDLLCDDAVGLIDAIAVAAVHFRHFAVFHDDFHHAAGIQLTAIAAEEFFNFHSLVLRDAETSGADGQPVRRHHLQVVAQQQLAGGDFPCVGTAVAVDAQGFAIVGSGEAHVLVAGLEKFDITQTQGFVFPAQLT